MKKSMMQRVGDIPFIGVLLVVMLVAAYIFEFTLGLAFALRALEITSVFDRWFLGYTAWDILFMTCGAIAIQWLLLRAIRAMT